MVGEVEAAGEFVSGAITARAVEPGHGEHDDGAGGLCLNCGTRRVGGFCYACGQTGHIHRTVGAIGHDIAHAVFHFEGKAWRTLPMLFLKPGELTRRYIAGERARFVSPMALFLFSVFLMFAVFANLPLFKLGDGEFLRSGVAGGMAEVREKLTDETKRADAALAETRQEIAEERADTSPSAERLARLEKRLARTTEQRAQLARAQAALPATTTLNVEAAPPPAADNWLDQKFRHALADRKLLIYKIKNSAYKFSWALIPISLPFIWLLFPLRRDVGFYDHAVFATYSLTFMSLLAIILGVLAALGVWWQLLVVAATLIPPFHLYRQLKGGYRLTRLGALWRLAWLLMFVQVTIGIFAMLLVFLGVAD